MLIYYTLNFWVFFWSCDGPMPGPFPALPIFLGKKPWERGCCVWLQNSLVKPIVMFSRNAARRYCSQTWHSSPRVYMVTMMEKAQRMRGVEKNSRVMKLVGSLITSLYVMCTRPSLFTFPQVQVTMGWLYVNSLSLLTVTLSYPIVAFILAPMLLHQIAELNFGCVLWRKKVDKDHLDINIHVILASLETSSWTNTPRKIPSS